MCIKRVDNILVVVSTSQQQLRLPLLAASSISQPHYAFIDTFSDTPHHKLHVNSVTLESQLNFLLKYCQKTHNFVLSMHHFASTVMIMKIK